MKSTNLLMNEHKHILVALNILEAMAERVGRGESIDDEDVNDTLYFLNTYADGYHQRKEEGLLFPAMLKAADPAMAGSLKHMIFEHEQERSLVEEIEAALRTKGDARFSYLATRLAHLLRTHIYKEDHILFDMAEDSISAEEDARVCSAMERFESQWSKSALDGALTRLRAVELKYLGKAA